MSNIDLTQLVTADGKATQALTGAKANAHRALLAGLRAAALGLTGEIPGAEQLSWTTKEAAARAHVASSADAAQTAMLSAEAAYSGETIADLAARVIANADAYRIVAAKMAGIRRKHSALIDLAVTVDAVAVVSGDAAADIAALTA